MAKVSEGAAAELELNDERQGTAKKNRHVVVALAHLNKRRGALLDQVKKLQKEIEELDAAILALG